MVNGYKLFVFCECEGVFSHTGSETSSWGATGRPTFNHIWRLKVPSKLKNYLWQYMRDILQRRLILLRGFEGLNVYAGVAWGRQCLIFYSNALRQFTYGDGRLLRYSFTLPRLLPLKRTGYLWSKYVEDENRLMIVCFLWEIWKGKNNCVFQDKATDLGLVISKARVLHEELLLVLARMEGPVRHRPGSQR